MSLRVLAANALELAVLTDELPDDPDDRLIALAPEITVLCCDMVDTLENASINRHGQLEVPEWMWRPLSARFVELTKAAQPDLGGVA